MDATTTIEAAPPEAKKRINWWMVGCIVSLLAFEVTREVAVLNAYEPMQVGTIPTVSSVGPFVFAEGRWKLLGAEKDDLVPAAVRIECDANRHECIEAVSSSMADRSFSAPSLNRFPATFTADTVTFSDDSPACVSYVTRIDLKLKKVIAVRERKPGNPAPGLFCNKLAQHLEMTLGDGWKNVDTLHQHSAPILAVLSWVIGKR